MRVHAARRRSRASGDARRVGVSVVCAGRVFARAGPPHDRADGSVACARRVGDGGERRCHGARPARSDAHRGAGCAHPVHARAPSSRCPVRGVSAGGRTAARGGAYRIARCAQRVDVCAQRRGECVHRVVSCAQALAPWAHRVNSARGCPQGLESVSDACCSDQDRRGERGSEWCGRLGGDLPGSTRFFCVSSEADPRGATPRLLRSLPNFVAGAAGSTDRSAADS